MKNKFFVAGILAFLLVFGLVLFACDDGSAEDPSDEKPVAERWWAWAADTSTVTIDYSVDADGVCTIVVGGTAEQSEYDFWKADATYEYTASANNSYDYVFEAWTNGADRDLRVQYYLDSGAEIYLTEWLTITDQRKTYTIHGDEIPKGGVSKLTFQCANQTGTFYVKIISITSQ